jgi:hypothetical protein
MSLRRISHKHTEEEVQRGFNILTGGELTTGLTIIKQDQQQYLKKPPQPWGLIQRHETSSAAQKTD